MLGNYKEEEKLEAILEIIWSQELRRKKYSDVSPPLRRHLRQKLRLFSLTSVYRQGNFFSVNLTSSTFFYDVQPAVTEIQSSPQHNVLRF